MVTDRNLATLKAAGEEDEERARETLQKAEESHAEQVEKYEERRAKLPTATRRLTAGYELRTCV